MNRAMIPISPKDRLTAPLQVSMTPSASWILKGLDVVGACEMPPGGMATFAGLHIVSFAFPMTITLKIPLSAGEKTYFIPATSTEIMIKAAHILLNAITLCLTMLKIALIAYKLATFAAEKMI